MLCGINGYLQKDYEGLNMMANKVIKPTKFVGNV